MSKEEYYAKKIFKMTADAEGLIYPCGTLSCVDRDFLTFELAFFYYFIYDYKIFFQLEGALRAGILESFLETMLKSRSKEFENVDEVYKYHKVRMDSYVKIIQETQKMGEFSDRCADYINTLLSFSEKNNVFTGHSVVQAESELKPQIEPNQYTEELKVLLSLSSSPLMIDGVDPTE